MSKSYLLIGGSSDIALVTASKLLDEGSHVTLLARDVSRVEGLVARGAGLVEGDALDQESVLLAIEDAASKGDGQISGVAHFVGSIVIRPPHALKLDAFEEVIRTNLTSAFLTLSLTGKSMLKSGGGRMVFVSSVAGSLGLVNHEAISAAKGGIESMVRSAAATYAQRGLRINAVAPGLTETKMAAKILASEAMKEVAAGKIPLKRLNQRDEIADTMHWMLTTAPDNFTGQVLHLDGGMSQILV